jgi:beta-glucanase (GH16 family)
MVDSDERRRSISYRGRMAKRVFAFGVPLLLIVALSAVLAVRAFAAPTRGPLSWSDEFSGPAGNPAGSSWRAETGGSGWGNQELQTYTSGTGNAALDGAGNLAITARQESTGAQCWYGQCDYTSARLITSGRFAQAYGHFEARIKIPAGQGMWPAFWLLGDDVFTGGWPASGEIDVMENVGQEPGTVHGSLHSPGHSGADSVTGSFSLPDGAALADDYHVYAVDWQPDSVSWSIDGEIYSTKTRADVGDGPWPFDHPFFVIINLAVGGGWPGSPDASTVFPRTMLVDYVRVYEDPSHPSPAPSSASSAATTDTPTSPSTPSTAASTASSGTIRGIGGRCVTLPTPGTDGTPLELRDCDGSSSQEWTFAADGTVRALGRCMDIAAASREDGAVLQAAECTAGPAQQFSITGGNDLVNSSSDKCVDVTSMNTANGARLQQWTCAGSQNQKFWRA